MTGTKTKILVVEDEAIVAMDIQRGLQALGYEVVGSTERGEEAPALAERQRPDLVLMDIRLQGETDGIEAAKAIRSRLHIPIIFLTAYADAGTVERAKAAEPFGYLLKPFEDQELHTAIELAMYKRQVEEETLDQAGEALRQSEERFRLLVDSLQDYSVVLLNPQGRVLSWNPGAERLNGYTQQEIMGQHVSVFYPPEDVVANRPDQVLLGAARDGTAHNEGWRVRRDGSRFWSELGVTALRDKAGRLVGYAEITRDLTPRKQREEEIRAANALLEKKVRERTAELLEANRELEAFTYSVAHDLRGPLRGLSSYLGVLREEAGPQLSPEAIQYLGRGTSCAERMGKLIDDLLHLSTLGFAPLKPRRTALSGLVESAMNELQPEAEGRQIEWEIGPLPTVKCDPGLMQQVFTNLLGNAVKYTRPRKRAKIHVGQFERDGQSIFFVRDNGVGFSMQYSDKLFKPFSRLHAADEFSGNGVGLATVERILRKHGGTIWAESEPGQGATFYFTIRCAESLERVDTSSNKEAAA